MIDDSMNDMTTEKGTPLSIFNGELSKFRTGQKNKNFLFITLPLVVLVILVGGYFAYRYFSAKQESKILNQDLANIIQMNDAVILKNQKEGIEPSAKEIAEVQKGIEKSKLNTSYGISREEIEKIKKSNQ